MNDFVGNILQNKFYACCYILLSGIRALNADAHLSAGLLCYFRATGAETSLLLTAYCFENCHPIHVTNGHYTRNISCITLLWLHHNHKMSISCHKNALVSIHHHQSVGGWLIFAYFVVRIFWRK